MEEFKNLLRVLDKGRSEGSIRLQDVKRLSELVMGQVGAEDCSAGRHFGVNGLVRTIWITKRWRIFGAIFRCIQQYLELRATT